MFVLKSKDDNLMLNPWNPSSDESYLLQNKKIINSPINLFFAIFEGEREYLWNHRHYSIESILTTHHLPFDFSSSLSSSSFYISMKARIRHSGNVELKEQKRMEQYLLGNFMKSIMSELYLIFLTWTWLLCLYNARQKWREKQYCHFL